jgi:hypothetical protein
MVKLSPTYAEAEPVGVLWLLWMREEGAQGLRSRVPAQP